MKEILEEELIKIEYPKRKFFEECYFCGTCVLCNKDTLKSYLCETLQQPFCENCREIHDKHCKCIKSEIERIQNRINYHKTEIQKLFQSVKETEEFKSEYNRILQKTMKAHPTSTEDDIKMFCESKVMDILFP